MSFTDICSTLTDVKELRVSEIKYIYLKLFYRYRQLFADSLPASKCRYLQIIADIYKNVD